MPAEQHGAGDDAVAVLQFIQSGCVRTVDLASAGSRCLTDTSLDGTADTSGLLWSASLGPGRTLEARDLLLLIRPGPGKTLHKRRAPDQPCDQERWDGPHREDDRDQDAEQREDDHQRGGGRGPHWVIAPASHSTIPIWTRLRSR